MYIMPLSSSTQNMSLALTSVVMGTSSGYHWHGWAAHPAFWDNALPKATIADLAYYTWEGFKGLLIMFDDGYSNMYGGYEYMVCPVHATP